MTRAQAAEGDSPTIKPSWSFDSDRRIKCRFCDWTVLAWRTNAAGEAVSGFPALEAHIEDRHPDDYDAIYLHAEGT